jgi:tight adherence protein B
VIEMLAAVLLTFAAVLLATFAFYFAFNAAKDSFELKRRLRQMATGGSIMTESTQQGLLREATSAEQFLARLPLARAIRNRVEASGVEITPSRFVLVTVALCVSGFCAMLIWKENVLVALLAALLLIPAPYSYLGYKKQKRSELFDEQLPDALTMVARSLRAGHSLASAVELISEEMPQPAGGLFKIAYEQQKFGVRMADALRALRGKIDSMDFNFFVTIVRINSDTGGNLSEILDKLAETIRSRMQIRRQVDVYTAEGRMSGYILVALPVAVFFMFYVMRPGYMDVFFTEPFCQLCLCGAAVGQFVGFLMIRKIVQIRI